MLYIFSDIRQPPCKIQTDKGKHVYTHILIDELIMETRTLGNEDTLW